MAIIEIRNLSYNYGSAGPQREDQFKLVSQKSILNNVNLSIQSGELVALKGPSGSGKSTLLALLAGFLRIQAGDIELQSRSLAHMTEYQLSEFRNRKIGFIFQQFHLLPKLTVFENIFLPAQYASGIDLKQTQRRVFELASQLGLEDRLHHRPHQLSGGQQQRVAIARALLFEPDIILADEPTGNLDSVAAEAIMSLIQDLHQRGKTVLIITHSEDVAKECERVIVLKDGSIIEERRLRGVKSPLPMKSAVGPTHLSQVPYKGDQRWMNWIPNSILIREAWKSIMANKLRSFLTMVGVVVGVSSIFAMLTLGDFLKEKVLDSYAEMGIDTVMIAGYPNWMAKASEKDAHYFQAFNWEKDLLPLKNIFPQVVALSPLLSGNRVSMAYGGITIESEGRIIGVNEYALLIGSRRISRGMNFSPFQIEKKSSVCIVGSEVVNRLFRDVEPLGQILNIQANQSSYGCKVVGVLNPISSNKGFTDPNLEVYVPFTFMQTVAESIFESGINRVLIQLQRNSDIPKIGKSIQGYFISRYGTSGMFKVSNDSVMIAQLQKFLALFKGALASIALICLLVGGVGITNMMLASIAERFREIGLRKALGASDSRIRQEILTETLVLCVLAGSLGILMGFGFYELVIFAASKFVTAVHFEWKINGSALILSFVSIFVVGVTSGLAPSNRARRLQILEALKSD